LASWLELSQSSKQLRTQACAAEAASEGGDGSLASSVLPDAFALLAPLGEEPAADNVEALLRRGDAAITAVNLAEALDVLQRVQGIPRRGRTR
jgi:hypothetical protein